MQYRSFIGTVEYSNEDKCFYGKVLFIPDVILYEGIDLIELEKDFQNAIDDYIH